MLQEGAQALEMRESEAEIKMESRHVSVWDNEQHQFTSKSESMPVFQLLPLWQLALQNQLYLPSALPSESTPVGNRKHVPGLRAV